MWKWFRISSYEPSNRAGLIGGTPNFVFCSYGKFNPGYRDEKCPKGPQNTCGTAFPLVSDLTSHVQFKMFRHVQSRGIRAGVFIWEKLLMAVSFIIIIVTPFKSNFYFDVPFFKFQSVQWIQLSYLRIKGFSIIFNGSLHLRLEINVSGCYATAPP